MLTRPQPHEAEAEATTHEAEAEATTHEAEAEATTHEAEATTHEADRGRGRGQDPSRNSHYYYLTNSLTYKLTTNKAQVNNSVVTVLPWPTLPARYDVIINRKTLFRGASPGVPVGDNFRWNTDA